MVSPKTRNRIVMAADQLFYQKGFGPTSFSDIAEAVQISRGNFYYHFKSKDDILAAVIKDRLAKTRALLKTWEQENDLPEDRIRCFIEILIVNRDKIKRYGCPVGTLNAELVKLNHNARTEARALIALFRTWLRRQFMLLGRTDDADELALHLFGRSQGVATLAAALRDEKYLLREVARLEQWLVSLQNAPHRNAPEPNFAKPKTRQRT